MKANPLNIVAPFVHQYLNPAARQLGGAVDLDLEVRSLNSAQDVNLARTYMGKVLLIVNTASNCGFTGQYGALEALYHRYRDEGLVVLGFPSNDFAGQEPRTEQQIEEFCRLTYGVSFPMFEKISVIKASASDLYRSLGKAAGYPRWNFHKYLVDRQGRLVGSYGSSVTPDKGALHEHVKLLLSED